MSRIVAITLVLGLVGSADLTRAQETVTSEPPPQAEVAPAEAAPPAAPDQPCPKGKRGGAIGGIVVGSVFWWVLPMSIPVLITQTKKLKAHNAAMQDRRCQYAPK